MYVFWKLTATSIVAMLAACSTDPFPPTQGDCADATSCQGGFTLSTNTVTFSTRPREQLPPVQIVRLHLTDQKTATIGVAYLPPHSDPGWLGVSLTGTASDFDVAFSLTTNALPVGQQSTVLTLSTLDATGKVLQTRTVQVNLTIGSISVAISTIANDFILGHSANSTTTTLHVSADATTRWQLTASASWITVPANPNAGPGQASITIDSSDLGTGTHTGSVTVTNTADSTDFATVTVTANVEAPTFTVSPTSITLGGADGLDPASGQLLLINMGTGTNAYPWSSSLTTASGGAWLNVNSPSGSASGFPTSIEVNANRPLVGPGRYTGAVSIDATIHGEHFSRTVPITFNKEGHWLNVSTLGAALSSFPGRSVLTRTLQVRSSQGRTDVPWTAQSDQSWLSVTPSGPTGGGLTLTANPSGLQPDHQYLANVTVISPDASILNQQKVRVGFRVGTVDPQDVTINAIIADDVANPVEPYVYTNTAGSDITVYDIYSGAVVHTFRSVVTNAGHMAMSSDGTILFVNDDTNLRVVALDAETGNELRRYAWASPTYNAIAYARPGAHPILLLASGRAYDVATGALYANGIVAGSFEVDPYSQFVYTQNTGISPSSLLQYTIAYTVLAGDPFVVHSRGGNSGGSNGQDLCVSEDASRVYTANGAPYSFSAFATNNMQQIDMLSASPYPNNAACGWNGLFFGGAAAGYNAVNVWVYRPNGTLVDSFVMKSGYTNNLLPGTLILSGDNTRVMASTQEFSGAPVSFDIRNAPSP